jgi:hypothetical protein
MSVVKDPTAAVSAPIACKTILNQSLLTAWLPPQPIHVGDGGGVPVSRYATTKRMAPNNVRQMPQINQRRSKCRGRPFISVLIIPPSYPRTLFARLHRASCRTTVYHIRAICNGPFAIAARKQADPLLITGAGAPLEGRYLEPMADPGTERSAVVRARKIPPAACLRHPTPSRRPPVCRAPFPGWAGICHRLPALS